MEVLRVMQRGSTDNDTSNPRFSYFHCSAKNMRDLACVSNPFTRREGEWLMFTLHCSLGAPPSAKSQDLELERLTESRDSTTATIGKTFPYRCFEWDNCALTSCDTWDALYVAPHSRPHLRILALLYRASLLRRRYHCRASVSRD